MDTEIPLHGNVDVSPKSSESGAKACWRSDVGVDGDFNKEGSGCTN